MNGDREEMQLFKLARATPRQAELVTLAEDASPERRCNRCGVTRPLAMFYVATEERWFERMGRRTHYPCRFCERERSSWATKARRDYLNEIKLARGCTDCGLKIPHPEVYDFDHLPQFEKVKEVAALVTRGTMDEFIAEIAKCEVVCANCHRIRTSAREKATFGGSWTDEARSRHWSRSARPS